MEKSSSGGEFSQEVLTVSQLIVSNTRKTRHTIPDAFRRKYHSQSRETPLMLYTSLKTYSVNRSRTFIYHLFNLGIGISYDRVLSITKNIYESLRESFLTYNCFFPNVLKKGILTVLIKDNIDVNATSSFIQQHYHGTSMSIAQFVTEEEKGIDFPEINIPKPSSSHSKKLLPFLWSTSI